MPSWNDQAIDDTHDRAVQQNALKVGVVELGTLLHATCLDCHSMFLASMDGALLQFAAIGVTLLEGQRKVCCPLSIRGRSVYGWW